MPSSKRLRLGDIVENCDRIARHVSGMSRDTYFADEKTIDAVERCLQRISEAAYKLGSYLDDIYPDTPWKNARGIGNILRHKYDQVTEDLIWASIEEDIPRLRKSALREIGRLKKKSGRASRAATHPTRFGGHQRPIGLRAAAIIAQRRVSRRDSSRSR